MFAPATAVPRGVFDAIDVLAHPERYPDRPSLRQRAVEVLMTAAGAPIRQSTRPALTAVK